MDNRKGKEEAVTDFIWGAPKSLQDGNCSHEIKRHLLLGRKAMTNLYNILKSRGITLSSFHGGSDSKESACDAGDLGVIPASGRCPGEGIGNPLQCSCHGGRSLAGYSPVVTKSQTQLSN